MLYSLVMGKFFHKTKENEMTEHNQVEALIKEELGEEYFRTWKIQALLEVHNYAFSYKHQHKYRHKVLKEEIQKEIEQLASTFQDWRQIFEKTSHLQSGFDGKPKSILPQKALEKMLELAETVYAYCYLYLNSPDKYDHLMACKCNKTFKEGQLKKTCREKILAMDYEEIIGAFYWFNHEHRYDPFHEILFERVLSLQISFDQPWEMVKENFSTMDDSPWNILRKIYFRALDLAKTTEQALLVCKRTSLDDVETMGLKKAVEIAKTFDECINVYNAKEYTPALEKALQLADSVKQCLIVASHRSWNSDLDQKAMEKAYTLAQTLDELMAINKKVDETSPLHKKILSKIKRFH